MLKTAFLIFVALSIAIVGGAASVWYALEKFHGVDAVTIGQWTTIPAFGTPDADPYSRARFARTGGLSLGQAEGIVFSAGHDSTGALLRRNCTYEIKGVIPPARFWTLRAADAAGRLLPGIGHRKPTLQSLMLLHQTDGSIVIEVGDRPLPGNWLAVSGDGPMRLVLTLYDTPISGETGIMDIELPHIDRTSCHD